MLKRILYFVATLIYSELLIPFAYDISERKSIPISGTKEDIQRTLVFVAQKLGVVGSWFAGLVATGISLFFALKHLHHEKKK